MSTSLPDSGFFVYLYENLRPEQGSKYSGRDMRT